MSQRKKIIIIASVLLIFGIAVAATIWTPEKKQDGYRMACDNLIAAITKKDYTAGYNLLSSAAKEDDSLESWKNKTSVLGNIYAYARVTFGTATKFQPNITGAEPQMQLTYVITHPQATSDVICIATKEKDTYVVDSFSNTIREDSSQ